MTVEGPVNIAADNLKWPPCRFAKLLIVLPPSPASRGGSTQGDWGGKILVRIKSGGTDHEVNRHIQQVALALHSPTASMTIDCMMLILLISHELFRNKSNHYQVQ
jgi:hypothetical protein